MHRPRVLIFGLPHVTAMQQIGLSDRHLDNSLLTWRDTLA